MIDLSFLTAAELAPLIETRQLSPVELTEHTLKRMEKLNPQINAYNTPLPQLALDQARKAEEEIMAGQYKGPLHGIPIGIKDNKKTKGIRTTAGSKLFANYVPTKSATVVNKLLSSGGIMVGKLTMHQLGAGLTGTNPFFGATRNPWNLNYMPGGSSSGSGAALASGLATLSTGTDTFGSIRVPAAMSGVYGLKPTYGLVSSYGVIPAAWSLDTIGPMARSVSDLALMLNCMAGFDPKDPASLKTNVQDYRADLHKNISGIKIGIPTYYLEGLDADVETLFTKAIATLRSLGAEIQELNIPELSMSTFAGFVIVAGEGAAFHSKWLQTSLQDYAPDARAILLSGSLTSAPQYIKAQQVRRKLTNAFQIEFKEVDVLLGPTIPMTTPEIREDWVTQNLDVVRRGLPFTVPANLTGIPSLTVPMGLSSKGLPVGMQFMGQHLSEKQLLQLGNAWQTTNPLGVSLKREEIG
ncbi:amidase [Mesobacillus maritimus]|uniref:Amidase n=1 Tax=Mesobacillus maritimus TaxID=1643336 RepID=A0ABS7K0E6_9BACI|nr:amidase [Mesobacillus maritimus]MBY0095722.1 amidase [Mesobacillus maritimus]